MSCVYFVYPILYSIYDTFEQFLYAAGLKLAFINVPEFYGYFNSSVRLRFTKANIKYGIEALRVRAERFFLLSNRKI